MLIEYLNCMILKDLFKTNYKLFINNFKKIFHASSLFQKSQYNIWIYKKHFNMLPGLQEPIK